MKRLLDSQAVDTSYKIGLRTLVIAGIIINILVSIIVVMAAQKIFNNMPMLMIITIVVLLLLVTVEAYFLLGFLIKPINVAAKRLVRLAEGDLHSDLIHHTYLTETSVMVRALNSVVKVNNEYIEEIKRVLKELEDKHLFVEVSKEFKGDYAAIKESLLKIVDFLNNTMSIIKRSSYCRRQFKSSFIRRHSAFSRCRGAGQLN